MKDLMLEAGISERECEKYLPLLEKKLKTEVAYKNLVQRHKDFPTALQHMYNVLLNRNDMPEQIAYRKAQKELKKRWREMITEYKTEQLALKNGKSR